MVIRQTGAARQTLNKRFRKRRNNMALTVATNTGALMAQAAASSVNKEMETSMERLSTGKRINAASDDAAGVAIASRLTAEIKGTNMALRNAMDGQALIDTAEGAHVEIENILQRMRELAVQAVNDTNNNVDRTYLQDEIKQLTTEIDRIANTTTWAGKNLLNGDFASQSFQVGSGSASANQITTTIDSMNTASIGDTRVDSTSFVSKNTTAASAETKTSTTFSLTGSKGSSAITYAAGASVKDVTTAVNNATSSTGVTATATNHAKLSALTATGTVGFTLTGTNGTGSAAISASIVNVSDLTNLMDKINAVAGTTGITAKMGATNASILLTDHDGDDIVIDTFTSAASVSMTVTARNFDNTTDVTSIAAMAITHGVKDSAVVTGTMRLADTESFTVRSESDGAAVTSAQGYFETGTKAQADSSLSAVSSVDIGTAANAKAAVDILDGALRQVSTQRGELGAVSNRIDSTVNNLTNIVSNLQAGRGRIQDADFAAETTNLAKTQILQQASTAMLAQANAAKQNVLSLLQG
jgi:flagellin